MANSPHNLQEFFTLVIDSLIDRKESQWGFDPEDTCRKVYQATQWCGEEGREMGDGVRVPG